MNILSFVDVHARQASLRVIVEKAQKADVLVCAGDLSTFGRGLKTSLQILRRAQKPLLIIPGNHETEEELVHAIKGLSFVTLLHGKIKVVGECVFVGYGGGGFSFVDKGMASFVRGIEKKLPVGKKVVFVTHAPPYNTPLDYLPWLREHRGCKTTMDAIKRLKPVLTLCGHFHETAHKSCVIGKTLVINPGSTGKLLVV